MFCVAFYEDVCDHLWFGVKPFPFGDKWSTKLSFLHNKIKQLLLIISVKTTKLLVLLTPPPHQGVQFPMVMKQPE